jgi:plasmid stabilization system protein ParE
MIRGVAYSRRAAAEIEEIMASIVEYSSAAANCFAQAVERAEEQLSRSPNLGAPGVLPGTRRLVVGNYIVSYRRRGDDVEIFAVRHARRRDARAP